MSQIIGINGLKGSGKDTLFNFINDIDPSFRKIAFADPIKRVIVNMFNLSDEEAYDQFKRTDFGFVSGRHIVREIGMLMKSYDHDQFVNYVRDDLLHNQHDTIITDVRFQHEEEFIKSIPGSVLVKIVRHASTDRHITERDRPNANYDFIIENTKSLDHLQEQTKTLLQRIRDKHADSNH
jgi:hypothetical protein